jgi:hypothetical protein
MNTLRNIDDDNISQLTGFMFKSTDYGVISWASSEERLIEVENGMYSAIICAN